MLLARMYLVEHLLRFIEMWLLSFIATYSLILLFCVFDDWLTNLSLKRVGH
jgi:hypothetical protein